MTARRLGFARGVSPAKWASRWAEARPDLPLDLVPFDLETPEAARAEPGAVDLALVRVAPGTEPATTRGAEATHHGVRLYTEAVALIVAADHELAESEAVDRDALALLDLVAHPGHPAAWPAPAPRADPAWEPRGIRAALDLVAAGTSAMLLPLPLARHVARGAAHAIVPVRDPDPLPGTEIWATWEVARDDPDLQQLVGILRGRTARSGRGTRSDPTAERADGSPARSARSARPRTPLPKNSRGAQLQAAQEKRDAAKRARAAKRRGRR